MYRVVCTKLGSLDHLDIEEKPDLTARAGQIVVDVQAAGITAVDALIVLGRYPMQVPTPFVPGHEIAGVVSSVGEGVAGYEVGDRVLSLMGLGGFSSQIAMQPMLAMRAPVALSIEQCGSLLQAYSTAYIALTHRLGVKEGERVLVLGAGGGVGLALVDVARSLGCVVIGAASTAEKRAAVIAQGAVETIAYEEDDLVSRARQIAKEHGGGIDVVVDLVGGYHGRAAVNALTSGGRLGVLGMAGGEPAYAGGDVLTKNREIHGIDCGDFSINDSMAYFGVMVNSLANAVDGTIRPHPPTTRPLDQVADTMLDLLERRVTGKVVMVP